MGLNDNLASVEDFIKKVQNKLNINNFNCGKSDGYLGDKTFKALRDLNEEENLKRNLKRPTIEDKVINNKGDCELHKTINNVGFEYNNKEDIYYSGLDVWQRKVGYCHLYDEITIHTNMVIDCEPIIFNYNNKNYMIEFWKGQYGISSGCEIGFYEESFNLYNRFKFYDCVDNKNLLNMSFVLKKDGKTLLKRQDKHWWLTGFKPGVYSNPSDLEMVITIELKDSKMLKSFNSQLKSVGYKNIKTEGLKVSFTFDKPYGKKPVSYTKSNVERVMNFNKDMCNKYNKVKKSLNLTSNDPCISLENIFKKSPELKKIFMVLGKNNVLDEFHSIAKNINL